MKVDMMNIQIVESKQDWETFLQIHPEANFLQSWQWGEFQKALGKTVIRTGLYKDGKLAGVFLSVVEPAKRGRYMTVAGGPILDLSDQQSFEAFVSEVSRIAKENSCVFVRVRPQLIENEISKKLFEKADKFVFSKNKFFLFAFVRLPKFKSYQFFPWEKTVLGSPKNA